MGTYLEPQLNLSDLADVPTAMANLGALSKVADTGSSGYTLVNSTGTILSWQAPTDGNTHVVMVVGQIKVGSTETGGAVVLNVVAPDGSTGAPSVFAAAQGAGFHPQGNFGAYIIESGSFVTLQQSTALSGGTAVLWAQLWAV